MGTENEEGKERDDKHYEEIIRTSLIKWFGN